MSDLLDHQIRIDNFDDFQRFDDFDDIPAYLNGDQESRQPAVEVALPALPTFLADDWDEETPITLPTLLQVEDGLPLFYAGESHSVSGPGGSGKTWLAAKTMADLVANDPTAVAVFVDYEGNRGSFKERMKSLGVTKAQAGRIAYWSLGESLMKKTPTGKRWLAWLDEHKPSFVCIDSVSKACAAAGINDETNDFQVWDNGVIVEMTQRRITSLRIDHTGHKSIGGSGGSRARGHSTKDQAISGASYLFECREHWTRTSDGSASLKVLKDRHGSHKAGAVAAIITVVVEDEGRKVSMSLKAPTSSDVAVEESKKTLTAPARTARALDALGTWSTKKQVQAWDANHQPNLLDGEPAGPLNTETCFKAMKRLSDDGKLLARSVGGVSVFAPLGCTDELPAKVSEEKPF